MVTLTTKSSLNDQSQGHVTFFKVKVKLTMSRSSLKGQGQIQRSSTNVNYMFTTRLKGEKDHYKSEKKSSSPPNPPPPTPPPALTDVYSPEYVYLLNKKFNLVGIKSILTKKMPKLACQKHSNEQDLLLFFTRSTNNS